MTLKAAVLGLDAKGLDLAELIAEGDLFTLTAVADNNTKVAEKTAQFYDCEFFDDYRQLIIQQPLDCLFVAAGLHCCEEHVHAAMKKGIHIFKFAPPARNFEEICSLIKFAEEADVNFAISAPQRFSAMIGKAKELIADLDSVYLIQAFKSSATTDAPSWHSDPELSGGGVLLRNSYDILDSLNYLFGNPEQIYCLNTNLATDRQRRASLTEETASVMMKFSDSLICNLLVSRSFGPDQQFIKVFSKDQIITITDDELQIASADGKIENAFEFQLDQRHCLTKQLENFGLSITQPNDKKLVSHIRQHLDIMAMIETAYLSSRTAMPESPQKVLGLMNISTI